MGVEIGMRRLIRELLTTSAANVPPSALYVEATTQAAHVGLALMFCLPLAAWMGLLPAIVVVLAGWTAWEVRQVLTRPEGLKAKWVWRDSLYDGLAYVAGCGLALADAGVWPWWIAGLTATGVVLLAAWRRRKS